MVIPIMVSAATTAALNELTWLKVKPLRVMLKEDSIQPMHFDPELVIGISRFAINKDNFRFHVAVCGTALSCSNVMFD